MWKMKMASFSYLLIIPAILFVGAMDNLQKRHNGSSCGGMDGVTCPAGFVCRWNCTDPDASGVCARVGRFECCRQRGEVYMDCGTACPKTCANYNREPVPCIMLCVEGCFCNNGTVRNQTGYCVQPEACRN